MEIAQYRKETPRTMPDLTQRKGEVNNSLHMTVGIMTEIVEIQEAFDKDVFDTVNLMEEVSDIYWYASNYANIHGLYFISRGYEYRKTIFGDLLKYAGNLLDIDKKDFAYNKKIDNVLRQYHFSNFVGALNRFTNYYCIDVNLARERNIAKLRARFPEKFDSEKAINRDPDTERKILEGDIDIIQQQIYDSSLNPEITVGGN